MAIRHWRFSFLILLAMFVAGGALAAGVWIWCTDYVAGQLGIAKGSYGDARTWWDDPRFVNVGYVQASRPQVGTIIVFNSWGKQKYGHVGIVRKIISSTEIRIDHANWHWDGKILKDVAVRDVSGSWSSVNVKYNPTDAGYGNSVYPVRGFLVPPLSSYSVLGINSPYFKARCIDTYPWDSRCIAADIDLWLECSDTQGGASPLCDHGIGGGDHPTVLPDFVVSKKVWLTYANGTLVKVFRTGRAVVANGQFKNVGVGDSPRAITIKFYLSNGNTVDSNKQTVGDGTIHSGDLKAGDSHTETETFNLPTTPGTYNLTACIDTGNDVTEEVEDNNCSDEFVIHVSRKPPGFEDLLKLLD